MTEFKNCKFEVHMPERLDKILANAGLGSRREVKALIKAGDVSVDGAVCRDPEYRLDAAAAEIRVGGRIIDARQRCYIMMNKPPGYLSATQDEKLPTVLDLLEGEYRRPGLSPAGRLDRDSRGLLILTNDGPLIHDIISPKKRVDKRYGVSYSGELATDAVERFAAGLAIDGGEVCLPAVLTLFSPGQCEVVIREGKYHQVKRMIAAVGGEVTDLKRESVGGVTLDPALPEGAYRWLRDDEVERLRGNTD